jgi:hypothetical protein
VTEGEAAGRDVFRVIVVDGRGADSFVLGASVLDYR